MGYRYHDGIIHAGMVRVIFELSDVKKTDGATHFIPGAGTQPSATHKSCNRGVHNNIRNC